MIVSVIKEYGITDNTDFNYRVEYSDGIEHIVPHSEANRHYQEIQEWAAIEGNNIIDPGA
jgi:hypothetical protein